MNGRVRLYGYARSEHSFAQVTRGIRRALESSGELAGFHAVDTEEGEEFGDGAVAPISLNLGAPQTLLHAHRSGQHQSHWLLLAPNSDGLPAGMLKTLREPSKILPRGLLTGGLLTPSAWAAGVLQKLAPDLPVIVAPHGVMPDVHRTEPSLREAARAWYQKGRFDVLHMTSSEHERKGTKLLLRAWKTLKERHRLPPGALLHVVMNPVHMNRLDWWCRDVGLTEVDVARFPGLAQSQADVVAMYGNMHAICQPSRGEGFGLVPLEALACGVPVVATACTGHSEYLATSPPGFKVVPHGVLAPMDDFPGAYAPSVRVADIEDALAEAFARWPQLAAAAEENADALRADWSWEKKNVPALKKMIQEAEKHVRPE